MDKIDHPKFLAIGFGLFAAIFAFTFLLLMLVSLGVFVGLGISFATDTGDRNQVGFGILGGAFAIIFYLTLGVIFVLPTALAGWKLWKRKHRARAWAIIGSIVLLPFMPLGTAFGIYSLWFFLSTEGKKSY